VGCLLLTFIYYRYDLVLVLQIKSRFENSKNTARVDYAKEMANIQRYLSECKDKIESDMTATQSLKLEHLLGVLYRLEDTIDVCSCLVRLYSPSFKVLTILLPFHFSVLLRVHRRHLPLPKYYIKSITKDDVEM
jgi:hypothetical protein